MAKITFKTELDNKDLAKDLKKVKSDIEREEKSVEKNKAAKLPLTQEMNELSGAIDEASHKLAALESQKKSIESTLKNGADPETYANAFTQKSQVEKDYTAQEKELDRLQQKWESVAKKVDGYDAKIKASTASISTNKIKAGQLEARLSSGGHKLGMAMSAASDSAKRFEHRIIALGKRVFVFSMITAALRAIRQYMGGLLRTNAQYQAELAKLKGAFMTAFQPIYEFILPGLLAVLRVITAVVNVVANVLSLLFGKTAKQSAANAKALNKQAAAIGGVGKAAKEASKDLASFDQINKLSDPDSGMDGGGGIGGGGGRIEPNFDAWDNEEYKRKIDELTVYLSGALLAIGAILAFSGVNIPRGIALMAAGAISLVAIAKENWNDMPDHIQRALTKVMVILGISMLAVGAVLAFSGISVLKGIALMALGAASLGGAAALNWNAVHDALQGPIGAVTAIASAALLALGVILCFSGVGVPLGISLILVGAAGLVTVTAINWDYILTKLQGAWDRIKSWWQTSVSKYLTKEYWMGVFSNITNGVFGMLNDFANGCVNIFRAMGNGVISLLERILSFEIPPINIGGKTIFGGYRQSVSIPRIPYLAQGAVLPANNPFLAVVGDQSSGTNIEAPLDTIKQAVAEVLGPEQMLSMMADIISLLAQIRDGNGEIDMRKLALLITKQQRNIQRAGG